MKSFIMKLNCLYIAGALAFALNFTGCTNLDEKVYSSYTDENFPSSPEQYASMTGPIYVAAQKLFDNNLYELQEMGTDEIFVPTRGGDWYDGGRYVDMHYHIWTPSHILIKNAWDSGFSGIGTCNQVLSQFEALPDNEGKAQTIAEIKIMRAWFYFYMMDTFGGVPIVTKFDQSVEAPSANTRQEVFDFIAKDLEENTEYLSNEANNKTYGRPTQGMAYTLAAKLYLNAEVYTGKPQWEKAEYYCDKVIALNQYQLGDYFDMFKPDNGAKDKEPIFSVPFDANKAKGNRWFLRTLHFSHQKTFSLSQAPYNGWCVAPDFFDFYTDDDIRKKIFLYGQQYDASGNPMIYNGVNVVLDPYGFDAFDVGGADDKGRLVGARCIKYYPDKDAIGGWANNDFVVFRYADVLMMKAEALLRQGKDIATAVELMNQIRSRAFPNNPEMLFTTSTLNLESLYEERGRELIWEMHRRIDMIRFGKFEDPMLFKPSTKGEEYRRIFPIPTSVLASNPNLDQNTGY